MSSALETISEDHRGIWRLTTALEELSRHLEDSRRQPDLELLGLIFDYIERYVEQVHQPSEEALLYSALRARRRDSIDMIEEFEREHAASPGLLAQLRIGLERLAQGDRARTEEFQEALRAYVGMMQEHIKREETVLFPAAREALSEGDWVLIDAAFIDKQADLEGVRADFRALMSRIVNLAPAPIGLGLARAVETPAQAQPTASGAQALLEIRGLSSQYGRIAALREVTLEIPAGQLVALVGANGAGKTTLLRAISGLQPVSQGSVRFAGEDITRLRADKRVRLGICQVPEGRQVFGPLSVADNLRLGAYTGTNRKLIAEDLERMYGMFPILRQKAQLAAGTLSGGQQQMLAMARALMGRPRLLLLDEPSMGLAPLLVEEIFNAIIEMRRQAITIFLIEQNAHAALAIADHAYVIEAGKIVLSGSGKALLKNDRVREAYLGI